MEWTGALRGQTRRGGTDLDRCRARPVLGTGIRHRADARREPELQSVEWLDGAAGQAAGAGFAGRSRYEALGEWESTSCVVEFEPERVFGLAVGDPADPAALWRFRLEPKDGGTELSEWVQMGPGQSGLSLAIDRMPDKEQKIVFVRMREFERNVTGTLERFKALAEA